MAVADVDALVSKVSALHGHVARNTTSVSSDTPAPRSIVRKLTRKQLQQKELIGTSTAARLAMGSGG